MQSSWNSSVITDAELLAMHPDLQKTQVDSLRYLPQQSSAHCSNIKGTTKTAFKTSSALGRPCLTELFPGFQVFRVKNIRLSHLNTPFIAGACQQGLHPSWPCPSQHQICQPSPFSNATWLQNCRSRALLVVKVVWRDVLQKILVVDDPRTSSIAQLILGSYPDLPRPRSCGNSAASIASN